MWRLSFKPFPVLTTERLVLRKLVAGDDEDLFRIRTNEKVNQYLGRAVIQTLEEANILIEKLNAGIKEKKWIFWALMLKNNAALLGTVCLWNIDRYESVAEIGFELHPEAQGKGYMLEVVPAVLRYGFDKLKLKKIEGWTHRDNMSSIRLLEKNGFVRDEEAEKRKLSGEDRANTLIYSIAKN